MTKRECAIIMAHTGVCMCAGDDILYFYKYVEELIGKHVYTHELIEYEREIRDKSTIDFIDLCRNATDK